MNLTDDQLQSLRADLEAKPPYRVDAATVLSLVEEVERFRSMKPLRESVVALAAKAEAGKGLYEAFEAHSSTCGYTVYPQGCPKCAALARWEAVENG